MTIKSESLSTSKVFLFDAVILLAVYFIPAISHLTPFPIYLLDPARLLLLTGFLLTRNNTNGLILAVSIPLISTIVTGHPPFFKAILISIELFINIYLFLLLVKKLKWNIPLILLISIIISKVVYYTMKYVFISFSLIDGELVTTNLFIQAGTVIFITLIFGLFYKKLNPSFAEDIH